MEKIVKHIKSKAGLRPKKFNDSNHVNREASALLKRMDEKASAGHCPFC